MPLRTKFYEFDAEIERLEERMEDLAGKVAPLEEGNPALPALVQNGQNLESMVEGLEWAKAEWNVDGVTLGGLTGGEYGYIEDHMGEGGRGKARVYFVSKGTVDAPYVSDEMGEDDRIAAVAALPIGYLRWADDRINDLMGVEGNERPRFANLLADARKQQTSTED